MDHMRKAGIVLSAAAVIALSGCGAVEDAVSKATDSAKGDTAGSPTAAAGPSGSSMPAADKPIGSASIDLGGSATSLPPEKESLPGATDCYAGESRIYDRHGVTCDEARSFISRYDANPAASKGTDAKIGPYTCSHNPDIMVTQGAAPAKCVDADGNIVFNWRYPGAPQPAKG